MANLQRQVDNMKSTPNFQSHVWLDEPREDDPFTANASYCHGYDVFGQLIQQASYADYMLLLFTGEKPTVQQSMLFETLNVALANLGPRDASVRAAMNAGVGGSSAASSIIAALAVSAGQTGGCRETYVLTQWFDEHGTDYSKWINQLKQPNSARLREDIWDEFQHTPGFKQYGVSFPETLSLLLETLCQCGDFPIIRWLSENRNRFEKDLSAPMAHTFIGAAVYHQLGLNAEKAEMCALLMSLPGAAIHALEAKHQGWRKFPFFGQSVELTDDPGVIAPLPNIGEQCQ